VCNFYAFAGTVSGFMNISTLVLISIDRFLVIKHPFNVLSYQKLKMICNDFKDFIIIIQNENLILSYKVT
jgi:hypothetical protein